MTPLSTPAVELDDEISASRRLRRMKRRLLLGATNNSEVETPPTTPSSAVRTLVNKHSSSSPTPQFLEMEPPISPRFLEDDEDKSKDLSIRSDPGPYLLHKMDTTNVSGVRKLRRIKRRLFLEQLASDRTATVPQNVATRSVSESAAAISPMKNGSGGGGGGIHDKLHSASEIVANKNEVDTVSPLPSPRLSATRLRRIKRRLFLDHLECSSDLDIGNVKMCIDDDNDNLEILQKASSTSLNNAGFMDVGDASPSFLKIDSWSDKVEHDRTLKEPPKLRVQVSSYPAFPDLNNRKRLRERDSPQEKTSLNGLSSKLEILSLKEAMKYNHKKERNDTALMGTSTTEMMIPKAEPTSNTAIYI